MTTTFNLLRGAALSLAFGVTAMTAQAATYQLSYTNQAGHTLTALITGLLQGDLDRVTISGITQVAYDAIVTPAIVRFFSYEQGQDPSSTVAAYVSLTGVNSDVWACADADCAEGFAFAPGSVIGFDVFSSSEAFGGPGGEILNPAAYSLTEVAAVPLPAGAVLLITALGGLAALRRKRV